MLRIFKSKEYTKAYNLLQSNDFFNDQFNNYKVHGIARHVVHEHTLFDSLIKILNQVRLYPLRILKIQLLIQCLLQSDRRMQQNQQVVQLLLKLRLKVRSLTTTNSLCTMPNQQMGGFRQNIPSSKDSWSQGQYIFQDGISLLMSRVVNPLLQLQERLIFTYDLVYRPLNSTIVQLNEFWAALNLLKKFVQISPQIEAIGRYYYKQYCASMISLIKVLDCDIQTLYKRIKTYICNKIRQYQVLFQNNASQNIQIEQQQSMRDFLQLIDELQIVNQYIRLLYINKYFVITLASNQIFQPILYKTQSNLDLIYHMKVQIPYKYPQTRRKLLKHKQSDESQNLQEV